MVRNKIRGILLLLVGVFAVYQGWAIWHVQPGIKQAWMEFGLAAVGILLGIWQLTLKPRPTQQP